MLGGVARREIAVHRVETLRASPFASSLLFDYVAAYMYDGDAPLAERRAGALTLDRDLLRELLGQEELRELLDPEALADLELSLQALTDERRATTADQLHDLLRRLGDLSADEIAARTEGGAAAGDAWLTELVASRRAVPARIAGEDRWIAIEDVARYRDGVGVSPPTGVPEAFLAPATAALEGLLARFARTHGPFLDARSGAPLGPAGRRRRGCARATPRGRDDPARRVPAGRRRARMDRSRTCCGVLRRRSLARLRREVEPVDPAALGRFLPAWHGVAPSGEPAVALRPVAALERLAEVVDQLAGLAIPASVLERDVLPARIAGLPAAPPRRAGGDGRGGLGRAGEPRSRRRTNRAVPAGPGGAPARPAPPTGSTAPPVPATRRSARTCAGAAPRSTGSCSRPPAAGSDRDVLDALWDLVWAGEVTNDTFAPLRALRWKRPAAIARRRPGRLTSLGPPEAAGRWSLVEPDDADGRGDEGRVVPRPTPTERLHALSLALLDRHGVVTREAVAAGGGRRRLLGGLRGPPCARGGRPHPPRLLRRWARSGAVRPCRRPRASPGPPRAGSFRAERTVHLLAAADPANPYGAAIPWPRRGEEDRRPLQRAAGAYVVLVDGVAVLYLERGGGTLQTLPAADDPRSPRPRFGRSAASSRIDGSAN